jgi:alpha-N-arabinofuranosidase
MILLGVVAAMAIQSTGIVNGDFTSGSTGWAKATYGAEPTVQVDSSTTHGPKPSLFVSSDAPTDTAFGQDIAVKPNVFYRLSGWVKTRGIKPGNAPVYGTIQIQLPGGASVLSSGHNHAGDTEWTQESVYFVGPGDGRARVALFLIGWGRGTGAAWFSDLKLETLETKETPMRITQEPLCPGRINPMQYGQFIEYLCDLVPSMWAEKLYDGSFVGLTPYKFRFTVETDSKEKPWYPFGQANRLKVEQDTSTFVSGALSKHIQLSDGLPCEGGIAQDGISLDKGKACKFSVWVKGTGGDGHVKVRLFRGTTEYASTILPVNGDWQKVSSTLTPTAATDEATISVTFKGPGSFWLDNISLMPVDTVGGWRKDVVKVLTAVKPAVIRVGGSVLDDANLGTFEWTDTIGDPDKRKPFHAWGGLQPVGAGLEEVVQLIQAVKAEPLICVRYEKKSPKDAADEVEYFNGSVDTPMGALRAKNGHPKPYGIKYWQVGNERWGEEYWKAVPEFCKAMLAVDPKLQLLTSFPSDDLIKLAAPYVAYTSPHQYDVENLSGSEEELEATRAIIDRSGGGKKIKLAITEWNTTAGDIGLPRAKLWTLKNALDCSRYQNLLHRKADLVDIANRSNLTNSFCSGIIQTNRSGLYLTPTYYAQYLYANLGGTRPLKIESELPVNLSPDTSATLSEDGKWLTVFAINESPSDAKRTIDLTAFGESAREAEVWTLADTKHAGEPDATNSFIEPDRITPVKTTFKASSPKFEYNFPPLSLTVLRWRVKE